MSAPGKTKQFAVGDSVYARYFGEKKLVIKSVAKVNSQFPHYICSLEGEEFLMSKLYISSKCLLPYTDDLNIRQPTQPIRRIVDEARP